jgi:hypothetical protein
MGFNSQIEGSLIIGKEYHKMLAKLKVKQKRGTLRVTAEALIEEMYKKEFNS